MTSPVGDPPDWLVEEGKETWHLLERELGDTLLPIDRPAFIQMCGNAGAAEAALRDLNERGPLVEGRSKHGEAATKVKNPANQIAREQSTAFRQWVSEFGLTPAARKRLSMDLSKKESPGGALID